jgi:hypothetical protein
MKKTLALLGLALLPLAVWAQSDAENDFFGEDAVTVTTPPVNNVDPTTQFSESAAGLRWGGTVTSSATWNGGWVAAWPDASAPVNNWKDGLNYGLSTKLFLDGRPDKDFRFRLSLKTGYPFTTDTKALTSAKYVTTPSIGVTTSSSTISVPNLKVWEMFTDVTVNDALFLRFGKQSASWGTSYFYSPGDVISLTAKDASDPTAEREGPVAMKATVPFPGLKANLTGFVLARDSYFGSDLPSLQTLGYALQADVLVGDAQVSLGGFYQRDNAPKAVATLNTGFGFLHIPGLSDVNLFSEAVFSYGADVLKTSGTTGGANPQFTSISSWDKTLYYTGTVGASYSNSDANLTLRAEYLYNPFGSSDKTVAQTAYNTFVAASMNAYTGTNTAGRAYGYGDAATPGVHYLTALASLAKFGGSDKLSFSTLWQQNFSDLSGWVKPSFTFQPWDQLGFTWGVSVVYGDDGTQYPLTFQYRDAKGVPLGAQRVTFNVGVTFGSGKY